MDVTIQLHDTLSDATDSFSQDFIVNTLLTAVFRAFTAAADTHLTTVSARPTGKAPTATSTLAPVTTAQR